MDISAEALAIARENAANLGLSSKIHFYHGSWWTPLTHLKGQVSGMISNPPYIPTAMLSQLQPEVRCHEPSLALDGGTDGLEKIRYLVDTAPDYLVSGGVWLIEMMAGQGDAIQSLLQTSPHYHGIQIFSDLAGIQRFTLAYRC